MSFHTNDVVSPFVEMSKLPSHSNVSLNGDHAASLEYIDGNEQPYSAVPISIDVGAENTSSPEQTTFMRVMQGHTKAVRAMAVYAPTNGDPFLLVTGGDDGIALVWNLQTFAVIQRMEGVHTHKIRGIAIYTPAEDPNDINARASKPSSTNSTTSDTTPKEFNKSAVHAVASDLHTRPLVVTGSDDKTAAVWDLHTGTLIRHLTGGHRWFIIGVSILMPTYGTSPFVVTTGWDNYCVLWNVSTGKQILRLASQHANAVGAVVSFVSPQLQSELGRNLIESAKSPFILTAGFDKIISIWDGETGQLLRSYPTKHTDIISCAAVYTPHHSEHGLYALTGSFDHTASSYNLLNGEVIRVLEGHKDWVTSVAMFRTNSGKPFFALGLTGCQDGTAILWDLVYGIAVRTFQNVHVHPVTSVRFVCRELSQGSSSVNAYDKYLRNCSMFYPVGGVALTDSSVANNLSASNNLPTSGTPNNNSSGNSDTSAASSSSNSSKYARHFPLILTASEDQRVVLWDLDCEQTVKFNGSSAIANASDTINTGGGYSNKNVDISSKNLSAPGMTITPTSDPRSLSKDWIICMKVFAPDDGRRPIIITGSTNCTVTVWDLLSNAVIKVLTGHRGDVCGVDVLESNHERYLKHKCVVASDAVGTTNTAASNSKDNLKSCASAKDSILLIVTASHDDTVNVYNYDNGEVINTIHTTTKEHNSSIAVSAAYGAMECAFLVVCSYDSTATIYNLYTNAILWTLSGGHTDGITNCTLYKPLFTANTRPALQRSPQTTAECRSQTAQDASTLNNTLRSLLLTTGIDGNTVVWDICSGERIRTLSGGHTERVKSVTTFQCKQNTTEPLVITGGYDKRTIVWSLNTGKIIRVLTGVHKNWVTAVAVVEPKSSFFTESARLTGGGATSTGTESKDCGSSAPFLVTGGFDGCPVLWDLLSGEFICKLECSGVRSSGAEGRANNSSSSSSSGIRAIAVYTGVTGDRGRYSPLVFTAGHDGCITQHDTHYPFNIMPSKSTVRALFHLDATEHADKQWPRISALHAQFGQCLWMENSELFIHACTLRRSDFLSKFQHMLGVMLPRMGETVNNKTMLRYCIETRDLQSTRILLKVWAKLLNLPILSKFYIKVHSSMYLHPSELLLLGRVYPAEFTSFIRSLRLILVDLNVCMSGVIDPGAGSVTAGCSLQHASDPYKLFEVSAYGTEESVGQPVTLCYLPLHHAASLEMLSMYLHTSMVLGSVEIFDTDIAVYALRYAWRHFAHAVHIRSTALFALFFVIYTPTMLEFEALVHSSNQNNINFGWFLQSLTFVCFLGRIAVTVGKVRTAHRQSAVRAYVTDPWVLLDVLTQFLGSLGLLVRYVVRDENDVSRSMLSITTILLWFRGLYYLRPFRVSGPLVSMVLAIAYDIRVFLLIMIMALFGFSQGFWLISQRGEHLPFGTVQRSMLSAFNYMMGSFDTEFEGSRVPVLGTFLVIVFVLFVIILMLNLLIALMGNTFSSVSEKGLAQWRQEQVSIVLEENGTGSGGSEGDMGKNSDVGKSFGVEVPPCLYVLMNTTDYEEYVENRDRQDAVTHGAAAVPVSGGSVDNSSLSDSKSVTFGRADPGSVNNNTVLEKVHKLERRLESLVSKLDYIASKMD